MATCLNGLVEKWCVDSPDPNVVHYLNELPGINLVNVAKIADHEIATGTALMDRAIGFAEKMVVRDFLQRFKTKFLFKETIGSDVIGLHGTTFQGNVAKNKGIHTWVYDTSDRYVKGHVEYIEINVEAAAPGSTIYYSIDGGATATLSTELTAGYNRVRLDLEFNEEFRVWFDTTAISLSSPDSTGYSCVNNCVRDFCCNNCIGYQQIEKELAEPVSAFANDSTPNGIVLAVSCKGDADELVCQYRNELATPILYRSGAFIMEELSVSSRGNPYVRNSKDEAKVLYIRWMGGVDALTGFEEKGEYPRLLQQVVDTAIMAARQSTSKAFAPTSMIMGDIVRPGYRETFKSYQKKY